MQSEYKNTAVLESKATYLKKANIIIVAKILIAAGLLFFLVRSIEYHKLINAFSEANLYIIALVFLLGVINIYLQYAKWNLTCSQVLNEKNKLKIFRSLFYGFSAGIITPFRIGEYFGRGIEFKDKSLLQVTLATLVDKFFPLLIVAFLGSISSLLFIYFYFKVSLYIAISLFILIFTLFYFLMLLLSNERFWSSFLFSRMISSEKIKSIAEKIKIFQNLDRNYFNKMLIISVLFYVCFLVQYALLVSAFTNHFDYLHYLWAANLIMFTKTIIPQVSMGELGIREGASVYFLVQFGESSAAGFNSSISLFIINLLIPALIGVAMIFRKNAK